MLKKLKLKIQWKKIFRLTVLGLVIIGFIITVGFTEKRQKEMLCMEMNITIENLYDHDFIDKEDVAQLIRDKFGILHGKPLNTINISLLENIINNNPFVSRAEVFSTIDGRLNIEVIPRNPVVRIMNSSNESFYIDEEGVFMPLSEKYSASVPVVSGFIPDLEVIHQVRKFEEKEFSDTSFHPLMIEKIYMLADYLKHHEFWNEQVLQVYVNQEGDLELIPRVGSHIVVFGDAQEIDEKFNKLFLFYREGLSKQGWNKYSTINLKFKDQVVCTKKITNGK